MMFKIHEALTRIQKNSRNPHCTIGNNITFKLKMHKKVMKWIMMIITDYELARVFRCKMDKI